MAKKLEEMVRKASKDKSFRELEKDASEWLKNKAKIARKENTARRDKRRSNLLGDESRIAKYIEAGSMYLYNYDAKYKATLPYYDRYPCIMLIDYSGTGHFIGLNLHYLPPLLRAKLLDAIMDLPTHLTAKKTAMLSYSIIRSFAESDLAKPCLKKYLYSHVQGSFLEIMRDEWHYISALPLAHFVSETGNASVSRVYKDSRLKIKG